MRIEKLEANYHVEVRLVHFPLHPDTPAAGMSLVEYFGGGAEATERLRQSQARLRAMCEAEGLPFGERTMTWNSRLAQELGAWAWEHGQGPVFDDLVYRAYFVDGRNISDPEVLVELAGAAKLDAAKAREVLKTRSYSDAVDLDWTNSRAAGVTAIPTYEAGGEMLVGAYPYEDLEKLVVAAGAVKRDAK